MPSLKTITPAADLPLWDARGFIYLVAIFHRHQTTPSGCLARRGVRVSMMGSPDPDADGACPQPELRLPDLPYPLLT